MKKFLVIGSVLFGSFFLAQETQANFLGGLWKGLSDKECGLLGAENILDSFDFSGGEKPIFDGPGLKRGAKLVKCRLDGGVSKEEDLKILLIGWAKFILSLASILAVVALIWAGFL